MSLPEFVAALLSQGSTDALVFPDKAGGYMRGSNVRRRWSSQAVTAAQLFPQSAMDAAGKPSVVYDFKLHELRHTAARPWRSRLTRTSRRCRTCSGTRPRA